MQLKPRNGGTRPIKYPHSDIVLSVINAGKLGQRGLVRVAEILAAGELPHAYTDQGHGRV